MRTVTIELDSDVAHLLELRAAIDDWSLKTGIEKLLTRIAEEFTAQRTQGVTL